MRIYRKKYYKNHHDEIREYQIKNRERILKYKREYRKKNFEKIREKRKIYNLKCRKLHKNSF
jgi:hypothetical protein